MLRWFARNRFNYIDILAWTASIGVNYYCGWFLCVVWVLLMAGVSRYFEEKLAERERDGA